MTSIFEDMEEMKRLADEFFSKAIAYEDNPKYAEERRINAYANESRKLPDGCTKENGVVLEPTCRDIDDIPDDLPNNNAGY